jgi:hypothetical protein
MQLFSPPWKTMLMFSVFSEDGQARHMNKLSILISRLAILLLLQCVMFCSFLVRNKWYSIFIKQLHINVFCQIKCILPHSYICQTIPPPIYSPTHPMSRKRKNRSPRQKWIASKKGNQRNNRTAQQPAMHTCTGTTFAMCAATVLPTSNNRSSVARSSEPASNSFMQAWLCCIPRMRAGVHL